MLLCPFTAITKPKLLNGEFRFHKRSLKGYIVSMKRFFQDMTTAKTPNMCVGTFSAPKKVFAEVCLRLFGIKELETEDGRKRDTDLG